MAYMFIPARIPAAPKPLSARPMMKAVDVGAVAERTDPIQKTNNDTSYKVFME
jgi:hypothetical protein